MRSVEALRLVFGSIVVYVVMAACASSEINTLPPDQSDASGSSGGSGSGSSGGSGSGLDDSGSGGILDALTDPVPSAKADPNQSGSRLKVKSYVGADGSKTFAGLHDSMLNVDCSFLPASDGMTRCLPTGGASVSFFSDATCSQPIGMVTKGCTAPPYANELVTGAVCASSYFYRVFPVGAAYAGAIYSGTPTSCTAASSDVTLFPRSSYDLYSLRTEVAPSIFLAATLQTDP